MTGRLRAFEANNGREVGINVLLDDVPVAMLACPHFEDMFWTSYEVQPTGPPTSPRVDAAAFWTDARVPRLVFEGCPTGAPFDGCFLAPTPGEAVRRVILRGDRVRLAGRSHPTLCERAASWWRSRRGTRWSPPRGRAK